MRGASARPRLSRSSFAAAAVAGVLGLANTAVSVYWALGGTALLDTVGGEIERWGRQRGADVVVALWLVVIVKLAVALAAPVLAAGFGLLPSWTVGRVTRLLTWVAAIVLVVYGGVLTLVGLLVLGGVIPTVEPADRRALAWHAFLWDPWFFFWGLALMATLWLTRPVLSAAADR